MELVSVLIAVIVVICVLKLAYPGKFVFIRGRVIITAAPTKDLVITNTIIQMRRSDIARRVPLKDDMVDNEVVVSNTDDCFYRKIDGEVVKYTRAG